MVKDNATELFGNYVKIITSIAAIEVDILFI